MGGWITVWRASLFGASFMFLMMAGVYASTQPEEQRLAAFLGGSVWAILFFIVAIWPRRRTGNQ